MWFDHVLNATDLILDRYGAKFSRTESCSLFSDCPLFRSDGDETGVESFAMPRLDIKLIESVCNLTTVQFLSVKSKHEISKRWSHW